MKELQRMRVNAERNKCLGYKQKLVCSKAKLPTKITN